ncbi:SpaA isopeptide-forming pilin-related protein [Lactiplantibacillus mudanjiangensis]|uniref:Cell surface protein [Lactobacillus brevis] n=2 Tax=Lactiplantibacillus mudanjiangensis TaxID=1296538 RepID=A0A660E537_9LACO|nr:SpaA isopeptide-forming pilin-related protein [Lactiplantibacillus mudanjiangensis]VDG22893.1 cell surface protein [Lactobacillus brevis] [Lactiplantibacillus mudanjiangensis]VDG29247.1 cell surface protein [Lactobacillus brevis] [Lactiplantibacillus mudanjiangensis]
MRLKKFLVGTATLLTLLAANTAKADTTSNTATTATTDADTATTSAKSVTAAKQVTLQSGSTTDESTSTDTDSTSGSGQSTNTSSATDSSSNADSSTSSQDNVSSSTNNSSHTSSSVDETQSSDSTSNSSNDGTKSNATDTSSTTNQDTSSNDSSSNTNQANTSNNQGTTGIQATDTTVADSDVDVDQSASDVQAAATASQVQAKSSEAETSNQQSNITMYSAVVTSLDGLGSLSNGTMSFKNLKLALSRSTVVVNGLGADDATISDGTNIYTSSDSLDYYSTYFVRYYWSIPDGEVINDGDTATVTLPSNVLTTGATAGTTFDVTDMHTNQVIGTATVMADGTTALLTFNDYYAKNPADSRQGTLSFNVRGTTKSSGDSSFVMNKVGWLDNSSTSDGHTGYWQIIINPNAETWTNVSITDNIGLYQTYKNDLWVESGTYVNGGITNTTRLTAGVDYTLTATGNELKITFTNPITTAINIEYSVALEDNHVYTNNATMAYKPADGEKDPGTGEIKTTTANSTGSFASGGNGTATSIDNMAILTKTDSETGVPVAGAVYSLYTADSNSRLLRSGITTGKTGQATINKLVSGSYILRETQAPDGYALNTDSISFVVSSPTANSDGTYTPVTVQLTTTDTPVERTSLNVTKVWTDVPTGTSTPAVIVTLYRNGDKTDQTLTLDSTNSYQGSFSNLAVTDNFGKDYTYTVQETVPDGYTSSQTTTGDTVTITNTYQYGQITLTKVGSDDANAGLAGATFELRQADGTVVDTQTTGTDGTATFTKVAQGTYTLVETQAPTGYQLAKSQTVTIGGAANVSTNYQVATTIMDTKIATTNITVNKVWAGVASDATTPDVTVTLYAGGQATDQTLTLTKADGYTGQFTNLATTDTTGHSITYTVVETPVAGYTTSGGDIVDGVATFTNTLQTNSLKVTKVDSESGAVLAGATFELKNGTTVIATATTDDQGVATFTGLTSGTYTLHEATAPTGYSLATDQAVTVDATSTTAATITVEDVKTTTPVTPTTTITVNKHWANTAANAKTPDVTVTLVANGESTGKTLTLTTANGYTGQFTDLATEDSDGTAINYTVVETPVAGYTLTGNTMSNGVITLTNTADDVPVTPVTPTGSITVTKVDSQTKAILAGATFKLVNATGETVTTGTTDAKGQVTFSDLALGTYQVIETSAPTGYTLNTTAQNVTVLADQTSTVTIEDTAIPTTPVTPDTPKKPNVPTTPTKPSVPTTPTTPSVPTVPPVKVVPTKPGDTFGEYEGGITPNTPTSKTNKPTTPTTTVKTTTTTISQGATLQPSVGQSESANTATKSTLPQTDEQASSVWTWLGLLSLVLVGLGYGYVRKQQA